MYHSLIALSAGFLLDLLLGDPHWMWHPVRGIGWLISKGEGICRKIFPATEKGERLAGAALVLVVTGISTALPAMILYILYRWMPMAGILAESLFCYQILATRQLGREGRKVLKELKTGNLEEARRAVSMIVGRDTMNLDESGITKATVETIAENTSDGSVAPLLYLAIAGPAAGFMYKAVNTMDSMIGYKNEKYLNFGRVAARLDDVLNFVPARLSAGLMILATFFSGGYVKNAFKIYKRDRYRHSSPNSAHTEAVMAGALGIRLGGDAWYFGTRCAKPFIGDELRPVRMDDIKRAEGLLYLTALAAFLLLAGIRYLVLAVWIF